MEESIIIKKTIFQKSLPNWISKRVANKIWKNKLDLSLIDKKYIKDLEKIIKSTKLHIMLYDLEKHMSLVGRKAALVQIEQKEVKFSYGDVLAHQIVFGEYVFVQVLHEYSFGNILYQITETWNRKKVSRNITFIDSSDKFKKKQDTTVKSFNEVTGLDLKQEWFHNLGFIPLVVFTNFESFEGIGESDFKDSIELLPTIDKHFNTLEWELDINKTRAFVTRGTSGMKNGSQSAEIIHKRLTSEVVFETQGISKDTFEYVQGNLTNTLTPIWKSFYDAFTIFLLLSGYTEPLLNNVGTVQQNNGEIASERITETDTILKKVTARESQISELLFIALKLLNVEVESEDIEVKIKPQIEDPSGILDSLVIVPPEPKNGQNGIKENESEIREEKVNDKMN